MLVLPTQSTPLRVMGIDPGTSTLGISLLSWDLHSNQYSVDFAQTQVARDTTLGYGMYRELHGGRQARLEQLADRILELFFGLCPHVVVIEAPFQGRFAQSFAALTECVTMVRYALMHYDNQIPLTQIDPITVKKVAGVVLKGKDRKKASDKGVVRDALASRLDLRWSVPLDSLDEHAVDAVAVALYYLRTQV